LFRDSSKLFSEDRICPLLELFRQFFQVRTLRGYVLQLLKASGNKRTILVAKKITCKKQFVWIATVNKKWMLIA
jgi:hypothetical protein